jgi:uncharacterized protein DUF932
MPRLTDLSAVLFEVEEHPVFASVRTSGGERHIAVPEKKAVVNASSGQVLGIVSRGYRVVTNREALDFTRACCRAAFPKTREIEWEVDRVDAPSTGGHCFIDLKHNSTALNFNFLPAARRPDAFGPFIRVTNSYNGVRALSFDIGFYRKVCRNGLILPDSVIRFRFKHVRSDIRNSIEFIVDHEKLTRLTAGFGKHLETLHDCPVPSDAFNAIVRGILRLRPPVDPETREGTDWLSLSRDLDAMRDKYISELGENAYAVFNVLTEFASLPPAYRCVHRNRHGLQNLVGAWVVEFSSACRRPGFQLSDYLANLPGDTPPIRKATNRREATRRQADGSY